MKKFDRKITSIIVAPILFVGALVVWLGGAGGKRTDVERVLGIVLLFVVGIPAVALSCILYICYAPIALLGKKLARISRTFRAGHPRG